tara:strand:+ start:843 stop:1262 length:420 start_codon:yes stop_codon:yes gene_type:complete
MNHYRFVEQRDMAMKNAAIANQATYDRVISNSSNGNGGALGRHLGIPSAYGNLAMQQQQMEMSNFMNSPKAIKQNNQPSFNNLGATNRLSDAFFGSQLGQVSPDRPAHMFGSASRPQLMLASLLISGILVYSAVKLYGK